jgi:hypothetical protein
MLIKERRCIICGRSEVMPSFICQACRARIQGELLGKRKQIDREARKALTKYGQQNSQTRNF